MQKEKKQKDKKSSVADLKEPPESELLSLIPKHPYRKFCFEKFKKLFLDFNWVKNTEYDILKKSLNIERSIFNHSINLYKNNSQGDSTSDKNVWNKDFDLYYRDNLRHIYINLLPEGKGSVKNPGLLTRFYNNEFNEEQLVKMESKDMHPEFWFDLMIKYPQNEDLRKMIEFKKQKSETNGILKCGKCKTYRTSYYQMQTRSGDEGSTNFCSCECGHRWKFS